MEAIHERVAGLDVHKTSVVACVRLQCGGKVRRECRTFETATTGLEALLAWLEETGCTHVAMEATGVYWRPVWNILSDGEFDLVLANAAHIKNVPGRKTDVNDATPGSSPRASVDRRSAGLRPDPGELRARPADAGSMPLGLTRGCGSCCARASSLSASRRGMCSASRRPWSKATSSWTR
jgi:hypothetical protein